MSKFDSLKESYSDKYIELLKTISKQSKIKSLKRKQTSGNMSR